jgi:hypothetical protein
MKIVRVKTIKLKDLKRGVRVGQVGTVLETYEDGSHLVDIPNVGVVTLLAEQVSIVHNA